MEMEEEGLVRQANSAALCWLSLPNEFVLFFFFGFFSNIIEPYYVLSALCLHLEIDQSLAIIFSARQYFLFLMLELKTLCSFQTHYVFLLSSFKEQLQQHVRVHAMEAVMACWELEQSLQTLTGFLHLLLLITHSVTELDFLN